MIRGHGAAEVTEIDPKAVVEAAEEAEETASEPAAEQEQAAA
jgi:hypothetical protein